MLDKNQTAFILIDVQGRLSEIVHDSEQILESLSKLIYCLNILEVPIIWVEQYPEGLGTTNKKLSQHLKHLKPISKITFDACKNEEFVKAVKATGRTQMLIAGIEAHVCVSQTAYGLKILGYDVEVAIDAVSSRTLTNKEIGLEKMRAAGIKWTGIESALFELMEIAEGAQFKQVIKLLK